MPPKKTIIVKGETIQAPQQEQSSMLMIPGLRKEAPDLFGRTEQERNESLITMLMKASNMGTRPSNQVARIGEQSHPFNFSAVNSFKNANVHHSTCIRVKVASTVGLGFKKDETGEVFDEMSEISGQDLLDRVAEDYFQTGNGLIEVLREDPRTDAPIVKLVHMAAVDAKIFVEDKERNYHWRIRSVGDSGGERRFARFGDLEGFLARSKRQTETDTVSEIIHIPQSTAQQRLYGMPDWLAAVASIELIQCLHQDVFDFYLNRGVPEFLWFILGKDIGKDNTKKIETMLKACIGQGNQHKSAFFNFPDPETKVQVEKLALENRGDGTHFAAYNDALALEIVSAHGVPSLLGGIQLPGKMAAANELPNALMGFQLLVISQAQKKVRDVFRKTLGNPEHNGQLKLTRDSFEFNEITEKMNLGMMDTVARMKDPLASPAGQTRDISAGLKKEDIENPEYRKFIGNILGIAALRVISAHAA